jgi:RimJ/RimL family protein N-acetyltransferase
MHALETPRLLLRPYRAEDWQEVHRYASIPEFSQYDVWGPNSAEDTKRFVADCIAHFAKDPVQRYDLAVERKNSEVFVGGCTLKLSTDDPDEAYLGSGPVVCVCSVRYTEHRFAAGNGKVRDEVCARAPK